MPVEDMIQGVWKPVGLNERFRLVRYEAGGKFLPHYDYGFKATRTKTSIQTVMMYLDNPEGSDTVVYTDEQPHYKRPREEHVLARIRPEPGMCLVFNPRITHGGDPVQARQHKHLLRTELMYVHHDCEEESDEEEPCWDQSDDDTTEPPPCLQGVSKGPPSRDRWLKENNPPSAE